MLFRQLFDRTSSTYTYLIAGGKGGEALLIDPVLENTAQYLHLIRELQLKLVVAIDTHVHADHITAIGKLNQLTQCQSVMGAHSQAECVAHKVREGERLAIDGIEIWAEYTPGHTDDSYSYVMKDRVFTGDCLLIRGTGRTDFQNGDPHAHYDSLFNKLLKLDDEMRVYPAHDYKGMSVSTIGEERAFNPRLQVSSAEEYAHIMNHLNLPHPKMMDTAVPANLRCGLPLNSSC